MIKVNIREALSEKRPFYAEPNTIYRCIRPVDDLSALAKSPIIEALKRTSDIIR
jgi:hypothetical protein